MEVTRLTTDVEQLRREKADLQGEIEAHKFTVRSQSCDLQLCSHVHVYTYISTQIT